MGLRKSIPSTKRTCRQKSFMMFTLAFGGVAAIFTLAFTFRGVTAVFTLSITFRGVAAIFLVVMMVIVAPIWRRASFLMCCPPQPVFMSFWLGLNQAVDHCCEPILHPSPRRAYRVAATIW